MKVADVMTRGVISLAPTDTMHRAAKLMLQYEVSGFPVVEQGKLVGIISEGDFLRRVELGTERPDTWSFAFFAGAGSLAEEYTHAHGRIVGEVMTRDVVTVTADTPLEEAVQLMETRRVKRLPVVDGDAIVGLISRGNLLRAFVMGGRATTDDAPVGDEAIRKQLVAELERQRWAPHGLVFPVVENGVVDLRGTFSDERQRTALLIAAENIPGVKQVHDHLRQL